MTLQRQYLPIEALPAWARLNGIICHGVAFECFQSSDGTDKGSAVIAKEEKYNGDPASEDSRPEILIRVPPDMVLSLELVDSYAKSDRYLREVLDAVGEYGRTARGAILIFLLLQITYSSQEDNAQPRIGVSNPWSEYIKFLPASVPLPTFYTDDERSLLYGTSLKDAVDTKIASLEREFEHLRTSTAKIPWCAREWWDVDTGRLTFDDWKMVDALYRSRALDLPGTGHAMVPCVDMANHASGDATVALYETDEE
ncbi:SET domain protein, partial [Rasamsonia emersonii CBS 393.64]